MKSERMVRPRFLALGVAGLSATALLGLAAGLVLAARNPQAARRTAQRMAGQAAHGFDQASKRAAQARERVSGLWEKMREEALARVGATRAGAAAAGGPGVVPDAARAGVSEEVAGTATEVDVQEIDDAARTSSDAQDSAPRKRLKGVRKPRRSRPVAPDGDNPDTAH